MTEKNKPPVNQVAADDEIDLIALAKTFWQGRKTVAVSIFVCGIIGIFVALQSSNVYTATSIMVPQMGDGSSKLGGLAGLGGLAAMAGISMDMSAGSELSPIIYPQIVQSIPFQLELMHTPLIFKDQPKPVSLLEYNNQEKKLTFMRSILKYTIGLPGVIIKWIKGKPIKETLPETTNYPIQLSEEELTVQKDLEELVSLASNAKEGYLTLTVQMEEPLPAAQLAQSAQDLLQRYITEFKIKKAKSNLDFIQQRYDETKVEFEKAQVSLAISTDRNKELISGLSRIETERLQSKYTITFAIFQELAKQLEQAKIQVKKETPVFTIIEPVTVPSERTKPKRSMIVMIWLFLGGVVGTGIVFGREFWSTVKEKWNTIPA